ncbi:MAG: ABC transporter permease [Ferruginibacter sp.]
MIKTYFKTAWRNITSHQFYSLVNVAGLFAGITFALLIGSYIWGELQVNKELRNAGRQYFLQSEWKDPNLGVDITTLGPLSKRLKEDYPGLVANYYRWDGITSLVSKGDKHFRENIQLGDSTLLKMYGFELQHGDSRTALNDPYSVVIAREIATRYFGRTDVVGETISIQSFSGGRHDFMIKGVLKDIPENSVTRLNAENNNTLFIPTNTFSFFGRLDPDNWGNLYIPSYIELQKGIKASALELPIKRLIEENCSEVIKQNLKVHVVALSDYYTDKNNGLVKRMLYILSIAGIFILLMAIVNFINITVSSSGNRMREIGVRKVLGGSGKQLIFQFLTESFILVFVATVFAVAAYPVASPFFSGAVGKQLATLSSFPVYFLIIPAGIVLTVGLLAGLYPAFVLSSLKLVDSLKGKLKTVRENIILRKSLVGFQFCMAILVLTAAGIVTQQVSFFFSKNLGYDKEYIVSSQVPRNWTREGVQKMEVIRNEFARMPQLSSVTLSYEIPNGMNGGQPPVYKSGSDSTRAIAMQSMITDAHYLQTYQIPMLAGSFLGHGNRGDSGKIVLNEKAVKTLGWKSAEEAIGQQVKIPGDATVFTIQGVTTDFHFGSMQQKIAPIIFFNVMFSPTYRYLSFKIKPGNIGGTIDAIQKKWAVLLPGSSFEYSFMDDTLTKLYTTEIQLKKAAYAATGLSLIIVLLGIVGLISLSIHKRVKEIGIRKVLGASLPHIIMLFVKEFIGVMVLAALVACPLSYLLMNAWLDGYEYRIVIGAPVFILSISALILITLMLITLQTLKAAVANPVKSLRTQ